MSDQLKIVEEKFASNNNIQILNEKTGEPETINKNVFMKSKKKKLNSLIYKVKEASKLSEIESVEIKKKSFLKEMKFTTFQYISAPITGWHTFLKNPLCSATFQ